MAKIMRKIRVGSVVGTRMNKTAVVELVWKQRHRVYRKQMRRVTRFYVHDTASAASATPFASRKRAPFPAPSTGACWK